MIPCFRQAALRHNRHRPPTGAASKPVSSELLLPPGWFFERRNPSGQRISSPCPFLRLLAKMMQNPRSLTVAALRAAVVGREQSRDRKALLDFFRLSDLSFCGYNQIKAFSYDG